MKHLMALIMLVVIAMSPGLKEAFGSLCGAHIDRGVVDFRTEEIKIDCWGTKDQMVYRIHCLWKDGKPVYIWFQHKGVVT